MHERVNKALIYHSRGAYDYDGCFAAAAADQMSLAELGGQGNGLQKD